MWITNKVLSLKCRKEITSILKQNKMVSLTDTEYNYYLKLERYAKDISLGLNVTIAKKLMKKLVLKKELEDQKFNAELKEFRHFI